MSTDNLQLRFLCLVFRHGDRAPVMFLPNDPHARHWPDGPANLTKKGQSQMYNLGRVLRRRYDSFLGEKPLSRDIYVRSTDANRCLASAMCCLAALYPPVDEEDRISPDLNWQPIPVHTMPETTDPFAIKMPAKYRHPKSGAYEDPVHNKLYQTMKKHQALYDRADHLMNAKGNFKLTMVALDTLLIEHQSHLDVPDEMKDRMADLKELFFACCQLHCVNHIESDLHASAVLKELTNSFSRFAANPSTTQKMCIYSLHDLNVITLIAKLTGDLVRCPTAACLIFEVCQDTATDEFYIKMLYLRKHDQEPHELKFQRRSHVTNMADFQSFVHEYAETTANRSQVNGHADNSELLLN